MPNDKPIVILIHGMGKHEPGSFQKQFVTAANSAMRQYQGFESDRIQDFVDLEEVNYDRFFESIRDEMSQTGARLSSSLGSFDSFSELGWRSELVPKLSRIERHFGGDEFLFTHFLDVVFYTGLLGGKVRVDVARQIAAIIAENPSRRIHVVAHSLGTAVLHDTLALLYRPDADKRDRIPRLDPVTHKLSSLWLIANVSRLVSSVTRLTDPYDSVVNPGPDGCTNHLVNVRHEFDPFLWFGRFAPQDDESWIPKRYFERSYREIVLNSIRQLNTHDFTDYIEHPAVSSRLLRTLVRLSPSQQELDEVRQAHRLGNIPGAYRKIRESIKNIEFKDRATLAEVSAAVRRFRRVIANAIGQRHAFAH